MMTNTELILALEDVLVELRRIEADMDESPQAACVACLARSLDALTDDMRAASMQSAPQLPVELQTDRPADPGWDANGSPTD